MTTQFVLRTDKKDGAGRCPVYLIAYFDGLRLKYATGEKCKPSEWNERRQRFRGTFTGADEANDFLELRAKQVSEWWRKERAADRTPTVAGLKAALRPVAAPVGEVMQKQSITVLNTEHREALRARGHANHALRQRKMLCNWLGNCERNRGELLDPTTYDLIGKALRLPRQGRRLATGCFPCRMALRWWLARDTRL